MSPVDDMGGGLRKRRTGFFVQVPRDTIRDVSLSFKARGLLAYLLDMPDGWDVRSEYLATQSNKDGRDAIQTGLKELRIRGYHRLERRRLRDGTLVMGTAISETPVAEWVEQNRIFDNKPVLCIQLPDGSFKVKMPDGALVDDGFESVDQAESDPVDEQSLTVDLDDPEAPAGSPSTGTGFSGAGESRAGDTGTGFSDSGSADSGEPRALRETEKGDREGREEPPLRSGSSSRASLIDIKAVTQPEVDDDGTPLREDVERLCAHLADRIATNGSKRPTVTTRWRDAARRLVDLDNRSEQQVHNMIEWCQDDEFWQSNILSMPKLREKYDQMRLKAMQTPGRSRGRMYRNEDVHGDEAERAAAFAAGQSRTDEEIQAATLKKFGLSSS
ncbi:MAG: hypothetical protein ACRCYR_03655 [Phycicoccus sp.]